MHLRVRQRRIIFRILAAAGFLAATAAIWGVPHSTGPIQHTPESMIRYRIATTYGIPGWLIYVDYKWKLSDPPAGSWHICPLGVAVALGLTAFAAIIARWASRAARMSRFLRRPPPSPFCLRCGYNLTGLPTPRCPECGHESP